MRYWEPATSPGRLLSASGPLFFYPVFICPVLSPGAVSILGSSHIQPKGASRIYGMDSRDGFLGRIPGIDPGTDCPALARVSARPVIARTILDSPRTPATDRHCTLAQKPCLSINALPIVPSAARGYGTNCLDRMVPKRERSLASGTIGPVHLAPCQDVSTHSLACGRVDVSPHSLPDWYASAHSRRGMRALTHGVVCERSLRWFHVEQCPSFKRNIVGGGAGSRSPATVTPVTTSSLYRATFPKRILPL